VLMPGDAIVIPPKVRVPGGALDTALQITSIVAQAATPAALIYGVVK